MFNFNYELSQDDKDKIRLSVAKLLFNKDIDLDSGVFVSELDGTETVKIVFKPKQ